MVLATIVASTTLRVVAMASSLSWVIVGTPACFEGVTCIMVAPKMLMHQDHGALLVALWHLVD